MWRQQMAKHGRPRPINLPTPEPAPWDEVRMVVSAADEPAPPTGLTAEELVAFLNGMSTATLWRYWGAVMAGLDVRVRASLRQQLGMARPAR
jgi:hypothetical protein